MKRIFSFLSLVMCTLVGMCMPAQQGVLANREYRRENPQGFNVSKPNNLEVLYLQVCIGWENTLALLPHFERTRAPQRLELLRTAIRLNVPITGYTSQRQQQAYTAVPGSTEPTNPDMAEIARAVGEAMQPAMREMSEIRSKLDALEREGKAPNDQAVKDLEARLVEVETDARLARSTVVQPTVERNNEDPFKGSFIKDLNQTRSAMRGGFNPETRAVDSALFATGGKLSPEQATAFIDFVIEKQATLAIIQTRRMMSPDGHTDELLVSARKMRAAVEGTAPAVANGIGTKRRTLATKEVIWAEDITLTFLEDNIEKRNAETHIARLLATQFGSDANDLGWNGDSASLDAFLNINDGWIKFFKADADVFDVDATGATKVSAVLKSMHKGLPVEFKGRPDLTYFVPVGMAEEYANEVSARETGFGDNVLVNGFPALRYFGRVIVPEPHIVTDEAVLTPSGNLFFGIQRSFTTDSEWVPRKRVVEWTLTARTDYEYATGKAVALADNIPAGLR